MANHMAMLRAIMIVVAMLALSAGAWGQARPIDPRQSSITLHVSRAGLFSFAGDNHEVRAPIAEGVIDESARTIELRIDAREIKALDPQLAPEKRAEVQQRMMGPEVLDATRYPEIRFRSTTVRADGAGRLMISGVLSLHEHREPVTVTATGGRGVYRGSASFKQTTFGIKPVSVGGGTVKVKDEIKLDFVVVATGERAN